jgi:hypothetical protein
MNNPIEVLFAAEMNPELAGPQNTAHNPHSVEKLHHTAGRAASEGSAQGLAITKCP